LSPSVAEQEKEDEDEVVFMAALAKSNKDNPEEQDEAKIVSKCCLTQSDTELFLRRDSPRLDTFCEGQTRISLFTKGTTTPFVSYSIGEGF